MEISLAEAVRDRDKAINEATAQEQQEAHARSVLQAQIVSLQYPLLLVPFNRQIFSLSFDLLTNRTQLADFKESFYDEKSRWKRDREILERQSEEALKFNISFLPHFHHY